MIMDALTGMSALTLLFAALCVFAVGYRCYGLFLANRALRLDNERATPAVLHADGRDYIATGKSALFGRHFAAIAGAGPLLGPVLAAQFGWLPGALWILVGCVLAGAVHDLVVLFASVRRQGQSLAALARREIGPVSGSLAACGALLALLPLLAGLALACAEALRNAPWSLFLVISSLPVAVLMGMIMRRGGVLPAGIVGLSLLAAALLAGQSLMQPDALGWMFDWNRGALLLALPFYGFVASLLPLGLLLAPRDLLAAWLKIGALLMLAAGIALVRPELRMPPLSEFVWGGGPVIGGPVLPFIFITIACGAVSGWHAVICGGPSARRIGRERDVLFVGYGAMLLEGFVAVLALAAACTLLPGDYFAINVPGQAYNALAAANPALAPASLAQFSDQIGLDLAGRGGGAVSLAVGMAHIFDQIPHLDQLMGYWYNLAVLFMAVFMLTAIDAGTRVGRLFLQELAGLALPGFHDKSRLPGLILASALFTWGWGYLAHSGDSGEIWPLFGLGSLFMAACGLLAGAGLLLRLGRGRYALAAALPGLGLAGATLWAGCLLLQSYLPREQYLLAGLASAVMGCTLCFLGGAARRWLRR